MDFIKHNIQNIMYSVLLYTRIIRTSYTHRSWDFLVFRVVHDWFNYMLEKFYDRKKEEEVK